LCAGANSGSLLVTNVANAQEPYNITVQTSSKTIVNTTDLFADRYQVTLRDSVGCVGRVTVTMNDAPAIVGSITVTQNASMEGAADGIVSFEATSGRSPFTYTVDLPNNTTGTVSNVSNGWNNVAGLAAGVHYVTCISTLPSPFLFFFFFFKTYLFFDITY
jgi:hypothetical protein